MTGLDQIRELEPGKRAVALRNVPRSLEVFATHFPRFPVLPGVFILDDLVSVAKLALGSPGGGWALCSAHRLRFSHFVEPGEQLELEITVLEYDGESSLCSGVARVDGKVVASVRALRLNRIESRLAEESV